MTVSLDPTPSSSPNLPDKEHAPSPLSFPDCQVLSISFHPYQRMMATGLINGQVHCYNIDDMTTTRLFASQHHTDSCRAVCFSDDGSMLFSASKDKSIQAIDVYTHKVVLKKGKAHRDTLFSLQNISNSVVASGDEAGMIRLWDLRERRVVQEYKEHEDFVSDFHFSPDTYTLISTGGDGYLSVFDIRKKNVQARSDNMEDELLSLAVMKNGKKVIVGSEEGVLDIWSWDRWGDVSDRFPGHPASIDSVCKLNEDMLITGSSDGLIRVVNILPNKLLGVVGKHEYFPIEDIAISHDRELLASCSHDNTIKFWNIKYLTEPSNKNDDLDEELEGETNCSLSNASSDSWESVTSDDSGDEVVEEASDNKQTTIVDKLTNGDEVDKNDNDNSSNDDEDSSDEEISTKNKKRKKPLKKSFSRLRYKESNSKGFYENV